MGLTGPRTAAYLKALPSEAGRPVAIVEGEGAVQLDAALQRLPRVQDLDQARRLLAITARINAESSLDELMDHIYESFRSVIPYDWIGLALLSGGRTVALRWVRSEAGRTELGRGYSAPLEGSGLEEAIETRSALILNDLPAYLEAHPEADGARRLVTDGVRSDLTCPLIAARPLGALCFASRQLGAYAPIHVDTFVEIAGQLALAVDRASLLEELHRASESKSRLLRTVAHDLRNPAAIARANVQLMLEEQFGPLTDEQREVLDDIEVAHDRMVRLINVLLDASAIEAGRLELRLEIRSPGLVFAECLRGCAPLVRRKGVHLDLEVGLHREPGGQVGRMLVSHVGTVVPRSRNDAGSPREADG